MFLRHFKNHTTLNNANKTLNICLFPQNLNKIQYYLKSFKVSMLLLCSLSNFLVNLPHSHLLPIVVECKHAEKKKLEHA